MWSSSLSFEAVVERCPERRPPSEACLRTASHTAITRPSLASR
jgi:hypothetical protein